MYKKILVESLLPFTTEKGYPKIMLVEQYWSYNEEEAITIYFHSSMVEMPSVSFIIKDTDTVESILNKFKSQIKPQ